MSRPAKTEALPGSVFGRLTVMAETKTAKNRRALLVGCSCAKATIKIIDFYSVTSGAVQSCGCHNSEVASAKTVARNASGSPRLGTGKPKPVKVPKPPKPVKVTVPKTPKFLIADEGRECSLCREFKAWDLFPKDRSAACKECYRNRDKEGGEYSKNRRTSLKYSYNISVEQYLWLLESQGGVCFLCGSEETVKYHKTGTVKRLAVDHDHRCCPGVRSCGKCVRHLLCVGCNRAAGYIESKPVLHYMLADYLDRRPLLDYPV